MIFFSRKLDFKCENVHFSIKFVYKYEMKFGYGLLNMEVFSFYSLTVLNLHQNVYYSTPTTNYSIISNQLSKCLRIFNRNSIDIS